MLFRNIKMTYNWMPCVSVSIGPDCQGCQPQKGESLPISCRSFPRLEWCVAANGRRRLCPAPHLMCGRRSGRAALGLRSRWALRRAGLLLEAVLAARFRWLEGKVKTLPCWALPYFLLWSRTETARRCHPHPSTNRVVRALSTLTQWAGLLLFADPLKWIHSLLCTRAAHGTNCSIDW